MFEEDSQGHIELKTYQGGDCWGMWMSLNICPSHPEFGKVLYSCSRLIVTLNETIRDGTILIDKFIISTLKSLATRAIWLALSSVIYS